MFDTDSIRIPVQGDKVHKEECTYSFDTDSSPDGLFVCMKTFYALGKGSLDIHYRKTKSSAYLHIKKTKIEETEEEKKAREELEKNPTKLGIGVDGGFDSGGAFAVKYDTKYQIYFHDDKGGKFFPYPDDSVPEKVLKSAGAIIEHTSASYDTDVKAFEINDERPISKHAADLHQVPDPPQVPPSGWVCEESGKTCNLWLNLSSGKILSGRKNYDGTGGTGAALRHYDATGYPLAVKLGTITPQGEADVYSYAEDKMVQDPKLEQHLAHFGIKIGQLQKTDKTLAEMEVDLNKFNDVGEYDKARKNRIPVYGPGKTGISNIGSTCYMNSVIQMLASLDCFKDRYAKRKREIFEDTTIANPTADFTTQMAKLVDALNSGEYSQAPAGESEGTRTRIAPRLFKMAAAGSNRNWQSGQQQCVGEYFCHLAEAIHRADHAVPPPAGIQTINQFNFEIQERRECGASGRVCYVNSPANILMVDLGLTPPSPEEDTQPDPKKPKTEESAAPVVPHLQLPECLKSFSVPYTIDDWVSPVTGKKTFQKQQNFMGNFPKYLLLQLKRFYIGHGWQPRKFQARVECPPTIDINFLRGKGKQQGEELFDPNGVPETVWPEASISGLLELGFTEEGAKRALKACNGDIQQAGAWGFSNPDDMTAAAPPPKSSGGGGGDGGAAIKEDDIQTLCGFGFTPKQAKKALSQTNGNIERAADWAFSHPDELDQPDEPTAAAPPPTKLTDGGGKYELWSVIGHLGSSAQSGHYVAYFPSKDGKWLLYDDERVDETTQDPWNLAYLVLYKRVD